jgi:hypothetical protein
MRYGFMSGGGGLLAFTYSMARHDMAIMMDDAVCILDY